MKNRYKVLIKDTLFFGVSSFGSKILIFLLTPLYTYILSTREYGIADLMNTTINFLYPILTFAISEATLRFAMDKDVDNTSNLSTSLIVIVTSTILLVIFYPIVYSLNNEIGSFWLFFVILYFAFNLDNCISYYLKGIGKTRAFAIKGILQTIIIILLNILFLVVLKIGIIGYLISQIIGYLLPIFIILFKEHIKNNIYLRAFDKKLFKRMIHYSLPLIPTLVAWSLNINIDKYMIIAMQGIEESGIYSVAHKIPTMLTTILSIFIQAWQLSAISNYGQEDEDIFYSTTYKVLDLVSIIFCLGIMTFNKIISKLLFVKDYFIAWKYVPFLLIAAMFSCHAGFLASAFRAAKKTFGLFISQIIALLINIILNFILVKKWGTVGAATATAICSFVVWFIRIVKIQQIVKVKVKLGKTIINYTILFTIGFVQTINIRYMTFITIVGVIVIFIVNIDTIKNIILTIKKIIKV